MTNDNRKFYFPKIRVRVAGVFVRDSRILLVKHRKARREYYLLPGGGQEPGESMTETLVREWKEELSLDIEPGEFLFMGESVPPKNLKKSQVVQITFSVRSTRGKIHVKPDEALFGFEWVPMDNFLSIPFFPACQSQIMTVLSDKKKGDAVSYSRYEWIK